MAAWLFCDHVESTWQNPPNFPKVGLPENNPFPNFCCIPLLNGKWWSMVKWLYGNGLPHCLFILNSILMHSLSLSQPQTAWPRSSEQAWQGGGRYVNMANGCGTVSHPKMQQQLAAISIGRLLRPQDNSTSYLTASKWKEVQPKQNHELHLQTSGKKC